MYNSRVNSNFPHWALEATTPGRNLVSQIDREAMKSRTFNVGNTLLQDLLQDLGVLKLLFDFGNDSICQLFLLSDLYLTFISYPGIKDRLGLGSKGRFLFKFKGLGFKLGRFLNAISNYFPYPWLDRTHLRDLK